MVRVILALLSGYQGGAGHFEHTIKLIEINQQNPSPNVLVKNCGFGWQA
jgi:hypothetical protein